MSASRLIIGCGYLGRRVARSWVDQGDDVVALTRSEANAALLRTLGVRPIVGDVMLPESLTALPAADTVLCAVGLDRGSGRSQREVYVDGLRNVLTRLAAAHASCLYVSSSSVYGQNAGEWVDERSECRPDSTSGQVCLDAERLLQQHFPSAIVLRLAGIYGPGRLVARIEQLRANAVINGNPDAWLNLIHVDDAAAAILACERRGRPGETYLVSDDRPHRRHEYCEQLARLIGAPTPRFGELLTESERAQLNKRCRNRRLREELAVALRYPTIAEGLPAALREMAGDG